MTSSFRWSILGTGAVAHKFVSDLACLGEQTEVRCVASRNAQNATDFASDLGIPEALSYDDAISADVDGVYIATPAAMHESQALAAIAAGKAVLIEKPMAGNADAARRISEAAKASGTFCMEAMWTRFLPAIEVVRAALDAGKLGEPIGLDARFMMANQPNRNVSIFDPHSDGGAMLHRGIYPLSLARMFLGPVSDLKPITKIGETGVDEEAVVAMRHENGAISNIRASLRANGPQGTAIYGSRATIYLDGPIYRPLNVRLVETNAAAASSGPTRRRPLEKFRESRLGLRTSERIKRLIAGVRRTQNLRAGFVGSGYHYQARAVIEAVRNGETFDSRMSPDESVEVLEMIDRIRADGGRS